MKNEAIMKKKIFKKYIDLGKAMEKKIRQKRYQSLLTF
jgi:hypothetical protein